MTARDDAHAPPLVPGHPTPRPSLATRVGRALFLSVTLALFLGLVGYRHARGQATESLMTLGARMMRVVDASRQDAPRELVLNGERVRFSTGTSPRSVSDLLRSMEARCDAHDGGLAETRARAADEHASRGHAEEAERISGLRPVLHHEGRTSGFVACVDMGESHLDLADVARRAQRFAESRDLHDFGDLRYVFAEPTEGGGSHFVAFWTEGSFRFDRVFPETGDAPGDDVADIERARGARRVLAARESGEGETATLYTGIDLTDGALERFYRRELAAAGWTVSGGAGDTTPRAARPALVATRGDRTAHLAFRTDDEGRGEAMILTSH